MASLLPGAHTGLTLSPENDSLIPELAGTPACNVTQKMNTLGKPYGDRISEMPLGDPDLGWASHQGNDVLQQRTP